MSINVYLKGDEVQKFEGFTTKKRQGGKPVQEWDEHELSGIRLFHDKGRWFIMLNEPTEPIPSAVIDIVDEISLHEQVPRHPKREAGIYRHESAEAEIESQNPNLVSTQLRIRAKTMENLLELYRKIKIGSIRPEQSYEGQQGGMSRLELEAELERQGANGALENLRLSGLGLDLRTFCQELTKEAWPFCTKNKVWRSISKILNNYCV